MNKEQNQKIIYIDTGKSKTYIKYDTLHQTAFNIDNGTQTIISQDRLTDFMNTAKTLGFNIGELSNQF